MKKSRYTEEQIAFALTQAELETSVEEVCRKMRHFRCDVLQLAQEIWWFGSSKLRRLKQLECLNANWFLSLDDVRQSQPPSANSYVVAGGAPSVCAACQ